MSIKFVFIVLIYVLGMACSGPKGPAKAQQAKSVEQKKVTASTPPGPIPPPEEDEKKVKVEKLLTQIKDLNAQVALEMAKALELDLGELEAALKAVGSEDQKIAQVLENSLKNYQKDLNRATLDSISVLSLGNPKLKLDEDLSQELDSVLKSWKIEGFESFVSKIAAVGKYRYLAVEAIQNHLNSVTDEVLKPFAKKLASSIPARKPWSFLEEKDIALHRIREGFQKAEADLVSPESRKLQEERKADVLKHESVIRNDAKLKGLMAKQIEQIMADREIDFRPFCIELSKLKLDLDSAAAAHVLLPVDGKYPKISSVFLSNISPNEKEGSCERLNKAGEATKEFIWNLQLKQQAEQIMKQVSSFQMPKAELEKFLLVANEYGFNPAEILKLAKPPQLLRDAIDRQPTDFKAAFVQIHDTQMNLVKELLDSVRRGDQAGALLAQKKICSFDESVACGVFRNALDEYLKYRESQPDELSALHALLGDINAAEPSMLRRLYDHVWEFLGYATVGKTADIVTALTDAYQGDNKSPIPETDIQKLRKERDLQVQMHESKIKSHQNLESLSTQQFKKMINDEHIDFTEFCREVSLLGNDLDPVAVVRILPIDKKYSGVSVVFISKIPEDENESSCERLNKAGEATATAIRRLELKKQAEAIIAQVSNFKFPDKEVKKFLDDTEKYGFDSIEIFKSAHPPKLIISALEQHPTDLRQALVGLNDSQMSTVQNILDNIRAGEDVACDWNHDEFKNALKAYRSQRKPQGDRLNVLDEVLSETSRDSSETSNSIIARVIILHKYHRDDPQEVVNKMLNYLQEDNLPNALKQVDILFVKEPDITREKLAEMIRHKDSRLADLIQNAKSPNLFFSETKDQIVEIAKAELVAEQALRLKLAKGEAQKKVRKIIEKVTRFEVANEELDSLFLTTKPHHLNAVSLFETEKLPEMFKQALQKHPDDLKAALSEVHVKQVTLVNNLLLAIKTGKLGEAQEGAQAICSWDLNPHTCEMFQHTLTLCHPELKDTAEALWKRIQDTTPYTWNPLGSYEREIIKNAVAHEAQKHHP